MTYEEFLIVSMNKTDDNLRRGQIAVSLLQETRPDLYDRMMRHHLDIDPFYLDTRIPKFLIWVGENW